MTKRIELDDEGDEWIEINKRVTDEVTERAMSENERFGEALFGFLSDRLTDEDED